MIKEIDFFKSPHITFCKQSFHILNQGKPTEQEKPKEVQLEENKLLCYYLLIGSRTYTINIMFIKLNIHQSPLAQRFILSFPCCETVKQQSLVSQLTTQNMSFLIKPIYFWIYSDLASCSMYIQLGIQTRSILKKTATHRKRTYLDLPQF